MQLDQAQWNKFSATEVLGIIKKAKLIEAT